MPPPHRKFALPHYKRPTTSNSQTTDSLSLSTGATLTKYIADINHEEFYDDEQTMSASQEYAVIRSLFCSLLCVPASSASVECFFLRLGSL